MKFEETMYGIDTKLIFSALKKWKIALSYEVRHVLLDVVGEAVVRYNKSKGMTLKTWVCYYVVRNIKHAVEIERRHGRISLDATTANTDMSLHNVIPSNTKSVEKIVEEKETKKLVHRKIAQLDKEGQFIMNYILQELDQGNYRWKASLAIELTKAGFYDRPISREWARKKSQKYMDMLKQMI